MEPRAKIESEIVARVDRRSTLARFQSLLGPDVKASRAESDRFSVSVLPSVLLSVLHCFLLNVGPKPNISLEAQVASKLLVTSTLRTSRDLDHTHWRWPGAYVMF